MHPNPAFRQTAEITALAFARQRGFGVLAINGESAPLTAHIPFVVSEDGQSLHAHLVVSNPVWRLVSEGPRRALVSVSGPDGYVSPDWYELDDQVPTWNYIAVNLRGRLSAMPQDRLLSVLDAISDEFETRLSPKPVWKSTKVPADALARMMRQIRPVEMQVETVESTYKLGQNKPDAARLGAAVNVETSPVGQDTVRLAAAMREAEP